PDYRLHLKFADGQALTVDLAPWIETTRALSPLKDPSLFAKAHLSNQGRTLAWIDDELELGADNLRNLAIEQSGGIGPERLWAWMHRNHLTQAEAAEAIGISRRMLSYYLSGAKPIPKTVWLACLGWEVEQKRKVA
ncbi:MAG: DUF2442 domain-containing protein, partial [Gammaproteobacteria bacterium]